MLEKCLVMLRLRASMRCAGDDGRPGSSKIMFVTVYTTLSSFRFFVQSICVRDRTYVEAKSTGDLYLTATRDQGCCVKVKQTL